MYNIMYISNRVGEKPIYSILNTKATLEEAMDTISGHILDGVPKGRLSLFKSLDFAVEVKTNIVEMKGDNNNE